MHGWRVPVDVVMERKVLANRWQSVAWQLADVVAAHSVENEDPKGVLAGVTQLADDRWLHRGFAIELFKDEGEGYWLNLSSGAPVIFVMWRLEDDLPVPKMVTLSYNEAARMMDAGETVDNVPMPHDLATWLAEFTQAHYRPEPKKRSRPPSFKGARRDE